jgi:opacity protein-like surface antigen
MFATAQISLAGKANLIFPTGSPTWKNISGTVNNAIENKGSNNVGFNLGLSLKVNLPTSFFLMPELYYTHFKNEFTDPVSNTSFDVKSNRIDLPVLLGHNVLGNMLGVFVGPVASYNLSKDNTFNDFKENVKNNFTVGYQFGAQLEIKKLIVNAKYEGAFSKDTRNFINKVSGEEIRYDNRPNLFMVGLGYKF